MEIRKEATEDIKGYSSAGYMKLIGKHQFSFKYIPNDVNL